MKIQRVQRLMAVICAILMILSLSLIPAKSALADDSVPAVSQPPQADGTVPAVSPDTPEPTPTGSDEVPPAPSIDVTLSSLTVTAGGKELTLNPAFSPDITNYTLSTTEHNIDIEATANGAPYAWVSGLGGEEFGYGGGEKTFPVKVTAGDETQQVYSIDVTCNPLDNANLKSLSVKHGGEELLNGTAPGLTFDPDTASYTIDTDAMNLNITAAAEDRFATGVSGDIGTVPLSDGENHLKVTVTAEDGTTTKDYEITVNCNAAKDDYLKSLTVSCGGNVQEFDKDFSPDVTSYNLTLGNWMTPADIGAEAENGSAMINDSSAGTYSQSGVALTDGETLKVTVESSDKSASKEYDIKIRLVDKLIGTSGDFKYEIRNSNIAITGYTGSDEYVTIPGTIDVEGLGSLSVTQIGGGAFKNNGNIIGVDMPDSVTSIGSEAFYCCDNLNLVTLSDKLTEIGDRAFEGCWDIDYFWDSTDDEELPDTLLTIGKSAFESSGISDIEIPASVTSIGDKFVYGCYNLDSIDVEKGNANYTDKDGILFNHDSTKLIVCPPAYGDDVFDYDVPDTVTSICDYAFSDCFNIGSVTLPASLASVSGLAFAGCVSNMEFDVKAGNTAYKTNDGALYSYDGKMLVAFPGGYWGYDGDDYAAIAKAKTSGDKKAYRELEKRYETAKKNIKASDDEYENIFTAPSGVTEIGRGAFAESFINDIKFENKADPIKIDAYAFYDSDLRAIVLPNNVSFAGADAFGECPELQSVTFEANKDKTKALETLSSTAFEGCGCLYAIYFEGNAPKVDSESAAVFPNCSNYLTIFHVINSTGFKSVWYGYPLAVFDPDVKYLVKYYFSSGQGDYETRTVFKGGKAIYIEPYSDSGDYGNIKAYDDSDDAFLGWYKDRYCTKPWCFGTDILTSNIGIYAGWASDSNSYLSYINLYDPNGKELALIPEFNAKTYTYSATLGDQQNNYKAVFEPFNDHTDVNIKGASLEWDEDNDFYYYNYDNIKPGQTVKVTITVDCYDDRDTLIKKTYTIYVTRPKSTDNTLKSLDASYKDTDFTLPFDPDTKDYTLDLDENTPGVTITAEKNDPNANVYIDGKARTSRYYPLNTGGKEKCVVIVVPQAGKARTYTVNIQRAESTVTDLNSLKTNSSKYPVTPALDNTKTDGYTVMLPDNVSSVTLSAAAKGYGASAVFTNLTNPGAPKKGSMVVKVANSSSVQVKVTVTAQASTPGHPITKEYTITVCRAPKLTGFTASPKSGSFPAISPEGDNRLTFSWKLANQSGAKIEVKVGTDWKTIYEDTDMKDPAKYTFAWDGKVDGSYLSQGTYKVRISAGSDCGTSSYTTLSVKVLTLKTPVVTVSPSAIASGGTAKTTISIKLSALTLVTVEVYNSSDVLVRTLFSDYANAGTKTVKWDGKDGSNTALPAGYYTIKVTAGGMAPVTETVHLT